MATNMRDHSQTDLGATYPMWVYNPVHPSMRVAVIRITPELATMWLERNSDNRKLRKHRAVMMAREMTDGNWKANGESISFDTSGAIVDGQHRLQAIVNSGVVSPDTPVVMGIDPSVRPTVDTGLKRNAADVLGMRGELYAASLAGALQTWAAYYNGDMRRRETYHNRLSHIEVLEWLDRWPTIRESVAIGARLASGGRYCLSASEASFVHFAIIQSGAAEKIAEAFIAAVLSGADLKAHSPILALRKRLNDEQRPGRRGFDKREKMALTLKAFQLYQSGVSRKTLRFNQDEEFPNLGIATHFQRDWDR